MSMFETTTASSQIMEAPAPVKKRTARQRQIKKGRRDLKKKHGVNGRKRAKKRKQSQQSHQQVDGFTVIRGVTPASVVPVPVAQPEWIRCPEFFDRNLGSGKPVKQLDSVLSRPLLDHLKANKIHNMFPVQLKVIPYLVKSLKYSRSLRPRDVCVSAPTGSGKTLVYVLSVIETLKNYLEPKLRVLVLLPISELTLQVKKVFHSYTKEYRIKIHASSNFTNLEQDAQSLMNSQPEVLICTPERLVDLLTKTASLDLTHLDILILDEADKLNMSGTDRMCLPELYRAIYGDPVNNNCCTCLCGLTSPPTGRISLAFGCGCSSLSYNSSHRPVMKWLFSATVCKDPVLLENMNLFHPILFSSITNPDSVSNVKGSMPCHIIPKGLSQEVIVVAEDRKPLVLWYLLQNLGYRRAVCFANLENVHRLYLLLSQIPGVRVAQFSEDMPDEERREVMPKFIEGSIDVMVATDMMARGMDVVDVRYVISYDVPTSDTCYVHRTGRTARAGRKGTAITLVTKSQLVDLRKVARQAFHIDVLKKVKVTESDVQPLFVTYEAALKRLGHKVHRERQKIELQKKTVVQVQEGSPLPSS